ncbi:MAG: hypothetical protein C0629_10690 [Chromatiales bacterium]|jgi:hypothetical protein|nr:hypothetical protein [Chromatiales bacterium]PLX55806.1 MAG: hypothetical protein C0629_10690 [Chromatiales bacterium]
MNAHWHNLVGMVGVTLILVSYLLLQTGRMQASEPRYSLANAAGAALVLISLMYEFNLSAAIIESFWLLISLLGLWRALRQDA